MGAFATVEVLLDLLAELGLNVVDAHISAHLDEFNVNDELSIRITPTLISVPTSPYGFGLSVTFNLKG